MTDELTDAQRAVRAARQLAELMRSNVDIRFAVSALVSRAGYRDVIDWAREHPDEVIEVAEGFLDMEEQAQIVEKDLRREHQ